MLSNKNFIKIAVSCVFILALSLAGIQLANAATYYVSTTGSNSNDGSQDHPWLTIQKAADMMTAGDTVIVLEGTYDRVLTKNSGSEAGGYITFETQGDVYTKGFDIINNYIKIKGFIFSGYTGGYVGVVNTSSDSSHCLITGNTIIPPYGDNTIGMEIDGTYHTVENNDISGWRYICVEIKGSNHLFENNTLHDSGYAGKYTFLVKGHDNIIRRTTMYNIIPTGTSHSPLFISYNEPAYDILIEDNIAYDCGNSHLGHFEQQTSPDLRDWTFRNNVFSGVGNAMDIYATGFKFYNNTFYNSGLNTGNALRFITADDKGVGDNGIVKNNIFIHCGAYGGDSDNYGWYGQEGGATGLVAEYNYIGKGPGAAWGSKSGFDGESGTGLNGGDPKWVDYTNHNFHLSEGSAAINEGTTIDGFSDDKDGIARPQGVAWDIGAYEYSLPPSPPQNLHIVQ